MTALNDDRIVFRINRELKERIKEHAWRNRKSVTQALIDAINKEMAREIAKAHTNAKK